jgi:hypothetical protein
VANFVRQFAVASLAILFNFHEINPTNPDRLREVLQRKSHRMIPAVIRLRDPFSEKGMWSVAVIAGRPGMVG